MVQGVTLGQLPGTFPPPTCGECGSLVRRLLTGRWVCTNERCRHADKRQPAVDPRLAALLCNVEEATKLLPPEEQENYARAQQSVIDARDYAQRHAHEYWVG
jgi:hypothetical protein